MKRWFTLETAAAIASWIFVLAFLFGAIYGSYGLLLRIAPLGLILIVTELFLIRRKVKARVPRLP